MIVYCDSENCIYNNGKGICEAGKVEITGQITVDKCAIHIKHGIQIKMLKYINCLTYVKKESEVEDK